MGRTDDAINQAGKRTRASRWGVILSVLVLLLGAAFIAYPFVSNFVNQAREHSVISATESAVAETEMNELEAERQRAYEYNERLLNGKAIVTDPFDPNAVRPTDEDYEEAMNLSGDGVMGTLNIPKIHLELPVYHGTEDSTLEHGVGHLQGTSLPIGGESSHCVLSGHTGLPTMKIFDNLDQLEVGDYFVLSVLGEDHAYEVTSIEVVLPEETDSLVIEQGRDLCTLVTCTPYGVNSHRLLVHAERCELPAEWLEKGDADFPSGYTAPTDRALLPSVLIGLALAVAIIGVWAIVSRVLRAGAERARLGRHFAGSEDGRPGRSSRASLSGRGTGHASVLAGQKGRGRGRRDERGHRRG